ncbi:MAG: tetratricopeptide repeat protein, partial [Spirochaetes bacterium]|nr:tetratricopeptide repeat protein [Spirochaetota bacterium]
ESVEIKEALAFALLQSGRLDRAERLYEEILNESPYRTAALYNLGLLHRELDRPAAAEEYLARAYETASDDADVAYAYGSLIAAQGRLEEAVSVFEGFVEAASVGDDRLKRVAEVFEDGEYYSRALEVYTRLVEAEVDDPTVHFRRARLLLTAAEDPDAGLPALREALERGYDDKAALGSLLDAPELVRPGEVEAILRVAGAEAAQAAERRDQGSERARPLAGRPYMESLRP